MSRRTSDRPGRFPHIPGYRIESVLGRGSMATVYKAVQVGMDRPVALKVLREDVAGEPKIVRRLMREARLAARLNHPHVVRAHDAGIAEDGACYFVMEFIDGASVRDVLMRRGKFEESRAVDVAIEIAEALFAFYREHIVHRDVKPANIMIDREGCALLADLGLAKVEFDSSMTSQNRAVGTPAYMSPEQARDPDNVDSRSDVFSLGATLYHMVTGVSPFDAPTVGAVVTKILYDDPPPIRELDPELSEDLERVVMRMIEKDRNARYETPGTLLRDLRALRRGAELPAAAPDHRRRNTVLAAAATALVAVVATVLVMSRGDGDGHAVSGGGAVEKVDLGPPGDMSTPDLVRAMEQDPPRVYIDELEERADAAIAEVFARSRALAEARRVDDARKFIEDRAPADFAARLGVPFAALPASVRTRFVEEQMAAGIVVRRIDDEWQDGIVETAADAYREAARDIGESDEYLARDVVRTRLAAAPVEHSDELDDRRKARIERALDDAVAGLFSRWRDRFENVLAEIRGLRDAGRLASARRAVETERSRSPERIGGGLADRLTAAEGRIDDAEQELQRVVANRLDRVSLLSGDGHPELVQRDTSRLLTAIRETVARLPNDLEELTLAAADAAVLVEVNDIVATVHRMMTELDTSPHLKPGGRATLETIDGDVDGDVGIESVAADHVVVRRAEGPLTVHARRMTPETLCALFDLADDHAHLVTAFLHYCDGPAADFFAAEEALAKATPSPCVELLRARLDEALAHFHQASTPAGKAALAKWLASLEAAREGDWRRSFDAVKELVTNPAWTATEWFETHREKIREHYDRAEARSRIAVVLGERGGTWTVEDEGSGLVRGVWEFATPDEAKGLGLPAGVEVDGGRLVRSSRARSVAPDRTEPVLLELPLDLERESAEVRFRYLPSSEAVHAPRCLTVGIGGHHVAFLGRLLAAGGSLHLPLHGLEREVAGLAGFGRAAYWKGPVAGYEAALRAAGSSARFLFECGKAYDVRIVVDPKAHRIVATVDGDIVIDAAVRELAASSPRITLRAPMPHAVDSLMVRGALDVGD